MDEYMLEEKLLQTVELLQIPLTRLHLGIFLEYHQVTAPIDFGYWMFLDVIVKQMRASARAESFLEAIYKESGYYLEDFLQIIKNKEIDLLHIWYSGGLFINR